MDSKGNLTAIDYEDCNFSRIPAGHFTGLEVRMSINASTVWAVTSNSSCSFLIS